jgi:transcriptional regulator with XRE-family HTH domain
MEPESVVKPSFDVEMFTRRLRLLRESKGISQEELAARAGLDRSYISLVERGRRSPTVNTLIKISTVLAVEVREFFE